MLKLFSYDAGIWSGFKLSRRGFFTITVPWSLCLNSSPLSILILIWSNCTDFYLFCCYVYLCCIIMLEICLAVSLPFGLAEPCCSCFGVSVIEPLRPEKLGR